MNRRVLVIACMTLSAACARQAQTPSVDFASDGGADAADHANPDASGRANDDEDGGPPSPGTFVPSGNNGGRIEDLELQFGANPAPLTSTPIRVTRTGDAAFETRRAAMARTGLSPSHYAAMVEVENADTLIHCGVRAELRWLDAAGAVLASQAATLHGSVGTASQDDCLGPGERGWFLVREMIYPAQVDSLAVAFETSRVEPRMATGRVSLHDVALNAGTGLSAFDVVFRNSGAVPVDLGSSSVAVLFFSEGQPVAWEVVSGVTCDSRTFLMPDATSRFCHAGTFVRGNVDAVQAWVAFSDSN